MREKEREKESFNYNKIDLGLNSSHILTYTTIQRPQLLITNSPNLEEEKKRYTP